MVSWLLWFYFACWPPFVVLQFVSAFSSGQCTILPNSCLSILLPINEVWLNVWRSFKRIMDGAATIPSQAVAYSVFCPFAADYSFHGKLFPRSAPSSGGWRSIFALDGSLEMLSLSLWFSQGTSVLLLMETVLSVRSCQSSTYSGSMLITRQDTSRLCRSYV